MNIRRNELSLLLHFLSICALLLFLGGFFPYTRNVLENPQTRVISRLNGCMTKLVLFVIDALRVDYVTPSSKSFMPVVQESIKNNNSCFLITRSAAPTVTMPRIKALTSGHVPSYLDVLFNFDSKEFKEDTFLRQAANHKLRSVFYGDDTWLKMFPKVFIRSGGVHSFFASDFWEVDKNITKGLEKELERTDWDILILHYLGLDHIGHIEGPFSSKVEPKLKEMDDAIKKIKDYIERLNLNAMFLVTGDHGMKDSGGHGGVTDAEIKIPLVSIGKACVNLPGWPQPWAHIPPQTDLASTISAALGLPIPSGSIGKIMPHLLSGLNSSEVLKLLKKQKHSLLERFTTFPLYEEHFKEDQYMKSHTNASEMDVKYFANKYYHELTELSEEITRQQSEFHLSSLVLGSVFLLVILGAVMFSNALPRPVNAPQGLLILGIIWQTISLASTSFIEEEHQTWYFLWATFLLLCLRNHLQQKVIQKNFNIDFKTFTLLSLCIMHRIWRKLNQTGDKWANLPDLDDYFRSNPTLLLLAFLSSLFWMYYLFCFECSSYQARGLFLLSLISILCYRLATGIFESKFVRFYSHSRGSLEVNVFFIALSLFALMSAWRGIRFYWTWALLCLITHRPHNIGLVPGLIAVSQFIHSEFSRPEDVIWNSLAHAWMGSIFYFYQGNSNSLANVDVAAGFIGIEKYSAAYAGFLIAVNTFSAPILSFLLSFQTFPPVMFARLLPLSFYCVTLIFQRHHLFVWSVFSPKLLLDSALYLILFLFFTVHHSHQMILNRAIW